MSNYDLLILALYIFIELHFTSVLKNVKKLTVLGQYPAILTSGLVNDAYIFCSCQLNHFYMTYLEQTLWMWLSTVITWDHPPFTRNGHVFLKIFSCCFYMTVSIWAGHKFERAR